MEQRYRYLRRAVVEHMAERLELESELLDMLEIDSSIKDDIKLQLDSVTLALKKLEMEIRYNDNRTR